MADSTAAATVGAATPPTGHRSSMRRPLRASSPSPTRNSHRLNDDLLARLSPASAWEALRAPTGALKACLDHASASEQSFALKTAVAAKKIHGWVDELSDWPWPAGTTYAGFETPPSKRRKLSEPAQPNEDTETEYMGSLTTRRVAEYETRVDQIQSEMSKLDIEDIKGHVLHTHIMPLSRPGTPMTDVSTALAYTKMEDLTAVVTAVTVQTLPYLAKLTRLMNTWSVRLAVLRKIPPVLASMAEAEVAMKSGWDAIETKESPTPERPADGAAAGEGRSKLSKSDFDVMNPILQQKVVKPGRDLDYMLDALEGMEDTLPDAWLDRMEALERDYADWALTAERRIQEGESSQYYKNKGLRVTPQKPKAPRPEIQIHLPSPTREASQSFESPTPFDQSSVASGLTSRRLFAKDASAVDGQQELGYESDSNISRSVEVDYDGADDDRSVGEMQPSDGTSNSSDEEASASPASDTSGVHKRYFSSGSGSPKKRAPALAPAPFIARRSISDLSAACLEAVEEEDEEGRQPERPSNGRLLPRMGSRDSMASTMVHNGHVSRSYNDIYRDISLEPEFAHLPDPDEPLSSDASPAGSPPLRYKARSASVTFNELPEISTLPETGLTPPRSPLEPPELFDPESSFEFSNFTHSGSPVRKEDSLHRQIRGVLRNLPGHIRLTRREASIELNPPDLNLPGSRMKLGEPVRRPGSAMSTMSNMSMASRSTTPSFLLAPAKSSRTRQRNSKDAQMYYLSRSSGEAPMKLLIRTVGENGERVMVRVGGGWADLGEYLKEYAMHHGRRSKGEGKVEVRDTPAAGRHSQSPPSRPGSSLGTPMTPLPIRKTRKSSGAEGPAKFQPKTPMMPEGDEADVPGSGASGRSASSVRSDEHENSVLGLSGPKPKKMDMLSEESRAWVEDVTSKVRSVSGEPRPKSAHREKKKDKFGELGKVGGTKRVFRRGI